MANKVIDLLQMILKNQPYNTLKGTIMKPMKACDFFNDDKTNSQLLQYMKRLLGFYVMPDTGLWQDKLTFNMNQILAPTARQADIDKLVEVADRIHISHNRLVQFLQKHQEEIASLKQAVEELTMQIKQLRRKSHSYSFLQQTTRKKSTTRALRYAGTINVLLEHQ